ncbi:hypothetical protein ACJJTC_015528 [Scirpophaga incertulas]
MENNTEDVDNGAIGGALAEGGPSINFKIPNYKYRKRVGVSPREKGRTPPTLAAGVPRPRGGAGQQQSREAQHQHSQSTTSFTPPFETAVKRQTYEPLFISFQKYNRIDDRDGGDNHQSVTADRTSVVCEAARDQVGALL